METVDQSSLSLSEPVLASLAGGETVAVRDASGIIAFLIPAAKPGQARPCGLAKGKFTVPDDFTAPDPAVDKMFYGKP